MDKEYRWEFQRLFWQFVDDHTWRESIIDEALSYARRRIEEMQSEHRIEGTLCTRNYHDLKRINARHYDARHPNKERN
jgi:hypothetical protein